MKKYSNFMLSSIMSILVILICCIAISVAWFSYNKNTNINTNINVSKNTLTFEYFMYKYNTESKIAEEVTGQDDQFIMNPYDSIILDRNEHTSIILKLKISGQALIDKKELACSIFCTETTIENNYLSNVIQFKFGLFDINLTDPNAIYLAAEEKFQEETSTLKFINNDLKNTEITYTINGTDYDSNMLYLFIQIDYAPDLIENITTFNIDDFGQKVLYQSDITKLELSAKGVAND